MNGLSTLLTNDERIGLHPSAVEQYKGADGQYNVRMNYIKVRMDITMCG